MIHQASRPGIQTHDLLGKSLFSLPLGPNAHTQN